MRRDIDAGRAVTACRRRPAPTTASIDLVPTGVVHAKQLSTRVTACGLFAESWTVIWDGRFARGVYPDVCERCVELVGA